MRCSNLNGNDDSGERDKDGDESDAGTDESATAVDAVIWLCWASNNVVSPIARTSISINININMINERHVDRALRTFEIIV